MNSEIVVFELKEAGEQFVGDINRLLAQLSSTPRLFSVDMLSAIEIGRAHV